MSHEQIIIRSQDFDPRKLEFGEVKTMKDTGAQFASVQYEGKKLYIQTPEMSVPFGMSRFVPKDKNGNPIEDEASGSWSLDLSFRGEDKNEALRIFHQKLDEVEDVLTDAAYENKWVKDKKAKDPKQRNKSVAKDVINKLISQQVKYSTGEKAVDEKGNSKYPPTMRVKVPYDGKNFHQTEAYDENKELIEGPLNEVIVKGCYVRCLLQCSAVYLGQSITLSWRLNQVKVRRVSRLAGYSFVDDIDGEAPSGEETHRRSKPSMIDDSDNDNDNDNDNDDSGNNNSNDNDAEAGSDNDNADSGSESDEEVVIPKKNQRKKN